MPVQEHVYRMLCQCKDEVTMTMAMTSAKCHGHGHARHGANVLGGEEGGGQGSRPTRGESDDVSWMAMTRHATCTAPGRCPSRSQRRRRGRADWTRQGAPWRGDRARC
jgi:hypothetical protein